MSRCGDQKGAKEHSYLNKRLHCASLLQEFPDRCGWTCHWYDPCISESVNHKGFSSQCSQETEKPFLGARDDTLNIRVWPWLLIPTPSLPLLDDFSESCSFQVHWDYCYRRAPSFVLSLCSVGTLVDPSSRTPITAMPMFNVCPFCWKRTEWSRSHAASKLCLMSLSWLLVCVASPASGSRIWSPEVSADKLALGVNQTTTCKPRLLGCGFPVSALEVSWPAPSLGLGSWVPRLALKQMGIWMSGTEGESQTFWHWWTSTGTPK